MANIKRKNEGGTLSFGLFKIAGFATLALLFVGPLAHAEMRYRLSETWSTPFADTSQKLSAAELAEYRGGFRTPSGFDFSFGLSNMHRINEQPWVAQTLFSVKDVIGGGQSVNMPPATAPVAVVLQQGPGNYVAPSLLSQQTGLPHTIIQNSLDNQKISNMTVYDFQLSNIGALTRGLNASVRRAAVSQQLIESIR